MSDELNLDPSLAYDNNTTMANATPQQQNILPHPGQYPPDRITVVVDRQHFIHTRNALNNAFMSLSSSIDRAVKAYADHTDAVISGDHTLDVSGLLNPFNQITQFAQQFNPAFFAQYNNGQAPIAPMEGNGADAPKTNGKKKRAYKQRDVNAPKRPLTAYFRFLKEQRPVITAENAETPGGEGGKAGDISKIATERWKALTDAQRAPYKLAYQHELEQYERDTKAYKDGLSTGVKLGAEDDEDAVMATPSAGPSHVVAKADDEDEDDEDSDASTSSEEDSDDDDESSEEEVPAKAPSPPAKKSKSAKKASVTAGADPAPQQMFSSLNPIGGPQPSSSAQKRKASDDDDEGGKKKKRGRPTKAEQEAAAAASQLLADESANVKKEKKKEKKDKKRKSEGAA